MFPPPITLFVTFKESVAICANVTEELVPTACPIAIVGVDDSPELFERVTPVPATKDWT